MNTLKTKLFCSLRTGPLVYAHHHRVFMHLWPIDPGEGQKEKGASPAGESALSENDIMGGDVKLKSSIVLSLFLASLVPTAESSVNYVVRY